jgi:hypothetical protein
VSPTKVPTCAQKTVSTDFVSSPISVVTATKCGQSNRYDRRYPTDEIDEVAYLVHGNKGKQDEQEQDAGPRDRHCGSLIRGLEFVLHQEVSWRQGWVYMPVSKRARGQYGREHGRMCVVGVHFWQGYEINDCRSGWESAASI